MDFSSIAISMLIVSYGVIEYRRREARHRGAMENPERAKESSGNGRRGGILSVYATGIVCALLTTLAGALFYAGLHSHDGSASFYGTLGCMITVLLLLLIMIFVREFKRSFPAGSDRERRGR